MDKYYEKKFAHYSRIVMMIILFIEFILNIVFLSIMREINAQAKILGSYPIIKNHLKSISAVFSLFFISFFVFILEFVANYGCCKKSNNELCDIIFSKLNHFIIIISFFICQFLYFTQSMIIPVFLDGVKINFEGGNKKTNIIKKKYDVMTAVCIIFLVLIIFLNFIVINLYKGICCQMEIICENTQNCIENFGRWFIDKLSWICCIDSKETIIAQLEDVRNEKDVKIYDLTGDIRNLMAENIVLNLKDLN